MYKIILASGSPRRKEILAQVGVQFSIFSSDKEEISTKTKPEDIVTELAYLKAKDVSRQFSGNVIIIGADTMVAFNGQVLGKPKNKEEATLMIQKIQGNKHQVHTGVSIIIKKDYNSENDGECEVKEINFVETTLVSIKSMTNEQIKNYVETNEPYDKAGGYGIQGKFAIYVESIEGDYYNVVGFPISKFYTALLNEGIDILQLKKE